MRKVIVHHYVKPDPIEGVSQNYILVKKGEATFHAFGMAYEEFESGPGNYSTAIVEYPDGIVENVPVERIKFI